MNLYQMDSLYQNDRAPYGYARMDSVSSKFLTQKFKNSEKISTRHLTWLIISVIV